MSTEVYLPEIERTCVNEEGNEWTSTLVSETASAWVFEEVCDWANKWESVSLYRATYQGWENKIVRLKDHTSMAPNCAFFLQSPLATDTLPQGLLGELRLHVTSKTRAMDDKGSRGRCVSFFPLWVLEPNPVTQGWCSSSWRKEVASSAFS